MFIAMMINNVTNFVQLTENEKKVLNFVHGNKKKRI